MYNYLALLYNTKSLIMLLSLWKKRILVDIYYKIILIMVENWENETNEKKNDQLKAEMMEYVAQIPSMSLTLCTP